MSIKAVLFDLDGTLLPMNQDNFIKKYFGEITTFLVTNGDYEPQTLMGTILGGIEAMIKNDGTRTNEEAFWQVYIDTYGSEKARTDYPLFERFYEERFVNTKTECGFSEKSGKIVKQLKDEGITVVLATNPVFPCVATNARISWAGLCNDDFEFVTTYENIGYCKPNPQYYSEIAKRLNIEPSECLMVGNDTSDDLSAEKIGMSVFILTDCLINTKNIDISSVPNGGFDELISYLEKRI